VLLDIWPQRQRQADGPLAGLHLRIVVDLGTAGQINRGVAQGLRRLDEIGGA